MKYETYGISFDKSSCRFSIHKICKREMSRATQPSLPTLLQIVMVNVKYVYKVGMSLIEKRKGHDPRGHLSFSMHLLNPRANVKYAIFTRANKEIAMFVKITIFV